MNRIENSYLTIEERVLLSSLDNRTETGCKQELEELMSVTPVNDDSYGIVISLYNKVNHGYVDFESDLEDLPEYDESDDTP